MYYRREIKDGIYHLSGNDRRLSRFENMFTLPKGVSYNSYLILDQKTCLIDGMDNAVRESFDSAVSSLLDGRSLDYFIIQHVEPDHCASINDILIQHPQAKLVISRLGLNMLKQFFPDAANMGINYDDISIIVKEGDSLDLGEHKLQFIGAANVHWPEVIMTYDQTSKVLFSADAFGAFRTPDGHIYADQVDYEKDWLDEARRYYFNIVGRQGNAVQKVLDKAKDLEIEAICPIHGLCYRTPETISYIVEKYDTWSSYEAETSGVVIVYSSMYGNNARVADTLAAILSEEDVQHIKVHDVSESEISEIIADLFRYSNAVIFGMNYNTELFPKMDALLREITMLNYQNRKISYIAAKSWGGRGVNIAQDILSSSKDMTQVGDIVTIAGAMGQDQLSELEDLAKAIKESL